MSTMTYCDACGEALDGRQDRRIVHVSIHDESLPQRMGDVPLDHEYDFHRDCFVASIKPTFDDLGC